MKKLSTALIVFLICALSFAQPVITKIGTYKCGRQPKQVLFSPDSKLIVLPLLDDNGFDIFSVADKKVIQRINPPDAKKVGFAEGLFIPEKKVFLVSQMTTANVYEYSYPGFQYLRTIPTGGVWSKFIEYSKEKNLLCVSNWCSNDISLIDYDTGKVVRIIKTAAAPRGLLFTENSKYIIALCYEGGKIQKFEVDTGKKVAEISITNSAMRHIAVNKEETKAYISEMYYNKIYEVDLASFKIVREVKTYSHPNTINLYNNRWLFVSNRGPNNPEDYTKRSPVNGKITIIDTQTMQIVKEYEGGNQPTGLDISKKLNILCSSNFQDENIELYEISE